MEVRLYNRDLASPSLDSDLTFSHERMKFSTRLNGGFYICSFRLKMDLPKAWDWVIKRIGYRLIIADGKQTLWEGRLEDIGLDASGVIVTAYGYYANLSDIPYNTAFNAVASVVIKAVLTANCAQISSDQSHIAATDITIDSAADASYADIYPQQLVEKLLAFSDSTSGKWYFAIWENRIPYLAKRTVSSVDWNVGLVDFNRFQLKHRLADLWNSVYAIYQAGGAIARTADSDNANSQTKYGLTRRYRVADLGAVAAVSAQAARDGWLEDHRDIYPRLNDMVLGAYVYDSDVARYPSSWIRAGQVLRVRDLVPASADAGSVARDALRTYYIVETEYDVDSRQLRIIPDTENSGLMSLLAKKLT